MALEAKLQLLLTLLAVTAAVLSNTLPFDQERAETDVAATLLGIELLGSGGAAIVLLVRLIFQWPEKERRRVLVSILLFLANGAIIAYLFQFASLSLFAIAFYVAMFLQECAHIVADRVCFPHDHSASILTVCVPRNSTSDTCHVEGRKARISSLPQCYSSCICFSQRWPSLACCRSSLCQCNPLLSLYKYVKLP